MDRAFRKLDTIKDQIVWWEAGAQPPQMLADQEVVMSTAYNGRIFNAQVIENQPLVIVWDGQVLDYGQIAIVTGTPNLELARKFLQYACQGRVHGCNRALHRLQPDSSLGCRIYSPRMRRPVSKCVHTCRAHRRT